DCKDRLILNGLRHDLKPCPLQKLPRYSYRLRSFTTAGGGCATFFVQESFWFCATIPAGMVGAVTRLHDGQILDHFSASCKGMPCYKSTRIAHFSVSCLAPETPVINEKGFLRAADLALAGGRFLRSLLFFQHVGA